MRQLEDKEFRIDSRIYYEITHRCNLQCTHCCNSERKEKESLTAAQIDRFQGMMSEYGVRNSVLTGGEPTLIRDFECIINVLTGYGNVLVTTNGTYYSAQEYEKLLERYPRLSLQFSLDGFSETSHDRIRGIGNFKKTTAVIRTLVKAGYSKRLGISCVLSKWNADEIVKKIEKAEEGGLGSIYFPRLIPSGRGRKNWDAIAPECEKEIEVELALLEIMAKEESSCLSVNRLSHFLASMQSEGGRCIPTLKVSPEGKVYPCPLCCDPRWSLGSLGDIENVSEIERRYGELSMGQFREREACGHCEEAERCPKNYCELCRFHSDSDKIPEEILDYQCEINKVYIKGFTEAGL